MTYTDSQNILLLSEKKWKHATFHIYLHTIIHLLLQIRNRKVKQKTNVVTYGGWGNGRKRARKGNYATTMFYTVLDFESYY